MLSVVSGTGPLSGDNTRRLAYVQAVWKGVHVIASNRSGQLLDYALRSLLF